MWASKVEGRSPWIHINPIIADAILSYIISAKCGSQNLVLVLKSHSKSTLRDFYLKLLTPTFGANNIWQYCMCNNGIDVNRWTSSFHFWRPHLALIWALIHLSKTKTENLANGFEVNGTWEIFFLKFIDDILSSLISLKRWRQKFKEEVT